MTAIIPYIDMIWIPLVWFLVPRAHRMIALGLVLSGILMVRLEVELMGSIGYPNGLFGLWDAPLFWRGFGVFSLFYAGFIVGVRLSPEDSPILSMAGAIGVFFTASCISILLMIV